MWGQGVAMAAVKVNSIHTQKTQTYSRWLAIHIPSLLLPTPDKAGDWKRYHRTAEPVQIHSPICLKPESPRSPTCMFQPALSPQSGNDTTTRHLIQLAGHHWHHNELTDSNRPYRTEPATNRREQSQQQTVQNRASNRPYRTEPATDHTEQSQQHTIQNPQPATDYRTEPATDCPEQCQQQTVQN